LNRSDSASGGLNSRSACTTATNTTTARIDSQRDHASAAPYATRHRGQHSAQPELERPAILGQPPEQPVQRTGQPARERHRAA
jgi:hypothetical protein